MKHIRLPVSFTYHADATAPYTLDPVFMTRLDQIITMAIETNGIKVILDQHHYDDFQADPVAQRPRALAMWQQIATRYANFNETFLYFEIQNEPHGAFNQNPSLLNDYLNASLAVIRTTNPTRKVLVGPNQWNGMGGLDKLILPNDPNLILTMHYYSPGDFTHQGAEWIVGAAAAGSVEWNPDKMNLWWWDYSWGLDKALVPVSGLRIKYNSGWSMLSLQQPAGVNNVSKVVITTNTTSSLTLGLSLSKGKKANGSWNTLFSTTFKTGIGVAQFSFNIPSQIGTVNEIHLQNMASTGQANSFFLKEYHMIRADGSKVPTFVSSAESIALDLEQMVRWGTKNNVPVHLGEFGAYRFAPSPSREKWTKTVRQAAEKLGMDWSYWELVAGFGFWDANANTWKAEGVKNALVMD